MPKTLISLLLTLGLGLLVVGQSQANDLPDFTELAEQNSPAVVNISTTRKLSGHPSLPPGLKLPNMPEHGDLGELFQHFFGGKEKEDAPSQFDATSLGSGFIISADGYVVTNNHVIKKADEIIVRLSDRREFEADVVGTDARTDIALLKIDATGLPTLKFDEQDSLEVGEWVLAIGSPFGFDHSVTAGIVSAKGRSLPSENYVPFIQTDVAINPGNSGGPLFNMAGEVVGINSQIYSRTGGFMGLSFAIPIDVAMDVVAQLKDKGRVSRGWLGVYIQPVTQDLAESFGLDRPKGALVAEVIPDSPAAVAGIQVGDIIVAFAGEGVPSSAALPPMVGAAPVGADREVKIVRQGRDKTIEVTIGELPEQDKMAQQQAPRTEDSGQVLGLELAPVPSRLRDAYELPEGGVLVEEVASGAAREGGIREGDVLLKIGSQAVDSVKQARQLLADLPKDRPVPVLVRREQGPIYLALRVGD